MGHIMQTQTYSEAIQILNNTLTETNTKLSGMSSVGASEMARYNDLLVDERGLRNAIRILEDNKINFKSV